MSDASVYTPPKVWTWKKDATGNFANINRPIAGPTHAKDLPVGRHPIQLYSLGTPNGVKVTVMLEESLALGHQGAEYDAWLQNKNEFAANRRFRERTGLEAVRHGRHKLMRLHKTLRSNENSEAHAKGRGSRADPIMGKGMDYWESGMHLAMGMDLFDPFERYQSRLLEGVSAAGGRIRLCDYRRAPNNRRSAD